MKSALVTAMILSVSLLGACSSTDSGEAGTETASTEATPADVAACEAIATRTDDLYKDRDDVVAAQGNDEELERAELSHWVGLERLNREMRLAARDANDETLVNDLMGLRDDDISYYLMSREASDEDIERVYVAMEAANARCAELGLESAEADTSEYPTY